MADATVRGRFVWHELLTPNPAGSHEFYGKAVGWKKQTWEQDPEYQMFAAPNGPIGGTAEVRNGTPQWLPYLGTSDVDTTVEAATRLGATVSTPPTALPNGARYAVLTDPQGATFGVYASRAEQPDTAPGTGEFSWHELATNVAPNIAFAFYAALFDWDEISQNDMGPMGMYLIFGRNGRQLGGIFDKGSAGKPGSAYWLGYVSVTDLEAAVERAKAARGSVLTGPMDVPGGGRIAQLMDPHGAFFALHMAAAARAAPAKPVKPAKSVKAAPPAAKPAKPAKAAAPKQSPARKATPKTRPAKKRPAKKRPARKAAAKKKPVARKSAKKKSKAKKPPRKAAKKTKRKAKARKRGR